jgi:hypothetical protein
VTVSLGDDDCDNNNGNNNNYNDDKGGCGFSCRPARLAYDDDDNDDAFDSDLVSEPACKRQRRNANGGGR